MKKICFMINTLTGGGAERVTSIVTSYLSQNEGMEIHLITLAKKEKEYELAPEVIRHNLDLDFNSTKGMVKSFFATRKYMARLNCDCYVGIDIFANIIVSSLGVFSKRKTIISERNAPKQVQIKGIMKVLRKLFYPFADCVVFQTEGARNDSPSNISKKGIVIPNPVKSDLPRNVPTEHIICAAARLSAEKNYNLLINSFAEIVKSHPEYKLSIFGQGIMENELKEYVASLNLDDKIIFEGYCTDVHDRMKNAEIFVLSSDYEGLPNSLLEAMAMGFAVISTDCPPGGPRSLIENGKNGLLVPVGDKNAMIDAMLRYIDDSEFRKSAGELALEVNDVYSVEKITSAWQKCIELVLTNKKRV